MLKKLMVLAVAALVLVACGGNQKAKSEKVTDTEKAELAMLSPDNFDEEAAEYVGKEIQMKGTIVHVCQHGGKRMFVFGEDSDKRVKITTGEDMAAFNTEWEGSDVKIVGVVEEFRVDEEYLATWQAEVKEKIAKGEMEHSDEDEGLHTGEEGHEEKTPEDELADIEELRNEIAESGSDHLSYYSIVCSSYEVMDFEEAEAGEEEAEDHSHEEGEEHSH